MADWFRSLTILAIAFVALAVLTLGLATVIVPSPSRVAGAPSDAPPPSAGGSGGGHGAPVVGWTPGEVGGTLAVSGDLDERLVLDAEDLDLGYSLTGAAGRILFDTDPIGIGQISVGGYEIYPDEDACDLTPEARDDATGVAGLTVSCEPLDDIRGKGTVTIAGTVGIAADLLGLRGDLPEDGGTVTINGRELTFAEAVLTIPPVHRNFATYVGRLTTDDLAAQLTITYDDTFHVEGLVFEGPEVQPGGACTVRDREIGVLNPHTTVVELEISCVDVPAPEQGTTITLEGSIVVELIELPA
ncbi:MAG TPA: hypothetical protein VHR55_12215 [Candidatus Limnocylindria bacterium]|nr:hypothetical protein [Candidatus Limnocylindria bacterium]